MKGGFFLLIPLNQTIEYLFGIIFPYSLKKIPIPPFFYIGSADYQLIHKMGFPLVGNCHIFNIFLFVFILIIAVENKFHVAGIIYMPIDINVGI